MSESPETLSLTFAKPIDGPAGPITGLELREPTAGEMLQWDKLSGVEADVAAISIVAGLPKTVVEKIPARDFLKAARFIASFLD